MFRSRYTLLALFACTACTLLLTPAALRAEEEQPLIDILQSDSTKPEKAIACKKLAIWGSAEAVPALAAILPDPELSSWARIALEAIPDETAGAALRDALEKVEGRTLAGVINSIGVREDDQAVDQLIARMADSDVDVAAAAIAALGRIGNEPATAALRKALKEAPEGLRSEASEGCIRCAETLLAAGDTQAAAEIYDEVRSADLPRQRIVEATRGAILARGADGVPLLVEQLQSSDKAMVSIALMTARELAGPGVSKKLVGALTEVAPDLQALLILAMADRQDNEAMPAMLEAAQEGDDVVRIAAIEVLKTLGDASCVPVLLSIAGDDQGEVAEAALVTLKSLPGKEIDADLVERLTEATSGERLALLKLVGQRRIDAVEPLLKAVEDADQNVRSAALQALGEVAKLDKLPVLITRVVDPAHAKDSEVALKALKTACVRMPDREACADKLAAALAAAPAGAKDSILETLATMGGAKALQIVGDAAKSDDSQLQDTASRLLGSWMTIDAGPVLLELAKMPENKHKVRALRGFVRLPRQFLMSDQQRATMCRQAWEAAERDAERNLVLESMERHPSVDVLRLATELADEPGFEEHAGALATSIAQKIAEGTDVKTLMEYVTHDPVKIEIIKATYGAGRRQKDVTDILQKGVRDYPIVTLESGGYNEVFGGDPARNQRKQLKVEYRMDGKPGEAVFVDNALLLLPTP